MNRRQRLDPRRGGLDGKFIQDAASRDRRDRLVIRRHTAGTPSADPTECLKIIGRLDIGERLTRALIPGREPLENGPQHPGIILPQTLIQDGRRTTRR